MALRFGTDGLRGVAFEELTPELVARLGAAAARVLGHELPFMIGRDTRLSGPALESALVAGLVAGGATARIVGVLPTPGVAFLADAAGSPAAMISASHNPYIDNGVKIFGRGGVKLDDATESRIEAELEHVVAPALSPEARADTPVAPGVLSTGDADASEAYLAHLLGALEGRRLDGLRVVLDCANGAAFEVAPEVFRRAGANVDARFVEPDGRNVNAGCGSTHPEDLRRVVVETGAALGLALDGDADRCIAVDEEGALVDGDRIMAIAAADLRGRGLLTGDALVVTVMSNLGLHEAMRERGIRVVETQVGDRYVLEALEAEGIALGGEQSGHVIFRSRATTGDGVLSGLLLADVMTRSAEPLSTLASIVRPYPQVLRAVRVVDRDALAGAGAVWSCVREVEVALAGAGRVLVRPSGTEPVVRIMVEARDEAAAAAAAGAIERAVVEALGRP